MIPSLTERFDVSEAELRALLDDTLAGADDGELFLEYREQESLAFDNGRLKAGNFSVDQGFGLRAVAGPCRRLLDRRLEARGGCGRSGQDRP